MNEKISLQIPEPCHADWHKMNLTEQGRFCTACSKQVIDFTAMTDQQVLNYFSTATGRICGRLSDEQLQRPLQPARVEKKKKWWIVTLMPLLLLFEKVGAQKKLTQGKMRVQKSSDIPPLIMGDTIIKTIAPETTIPQTTIKGKVVDEKGNAVKWATIEDIASHIYATADSAGAFSITIEKHSGPVNIKASAIGYEAVSQLVTEPDSVNIILKRKENDLKPVSVITNCSTIRLGGASVCRKVTPRQKIETAWRKVTGNTVFKVYPNPATSGADVKVDLKSEGDYSIQLITIAGTILTMKEVKVAKGSTITSINIPLGIAQGIYYLRVSNNKNNKQYTDKIFIQ